MLYTKILKNNYQDSINLMLLTNKINELPNVNMSQIMMGTDANKDILNNTNLLTEEAKEASANDVIIVVDTNDSDIDGILNKVNEFLSNLTLENKVEQKRYSTSWEEALEALPDANIALFSIPGEYAPAEMEVALNKGLNVFSFTDNISVEDELKLKKIAKEKGLLMMGPDCGTGLISGIPLAFTNAVSSGNIGVVGASGTGIQEVITIIDRLGAGVLHAIGTGGRDLSEKIGAITAKEAILALENEDLIDVICVISKPPSSDVRDEVFKLLQSISKPVVAIFIGEKPKEHVGNVYLAHTLEEAAKLSFDLASGNKVRKNYEEPLKNRNLNKLENGKLVKGLFSGGTLASEAAMLILESLNIETSEMKKFNKKEGCVLNLEDYEIIDFGDDFYTMGKPHPMIDPESRVKKIKECYRDKEVGIILFDIVLGYGAHENMAEELIPTIKEGIQLAKEENRKLYFIASVVGTDKDPQNYSKVVAELEKAGVMVENSNAKCIKLALKLKGYEAKEIDKDLVEYTGNKVKYSKPHNNVIELLKNKPKVINVGLKKFNKSIEDSHGEVEYFNWKPRANGNKKMIKILNALDNIKEEIDRDNNEVVEKLKKAQPFLVDVVRAKDVIKEFNLDNKVILHAGPPIKWEEMTGPMKGACIGAVLFENWADNEEKALDLLNRGDVKFIPCHHVSAVGPMGGITSPNMAVLVVENMYDNTRAYCTLNEGIGKVLRFGAYSEEVINRLNWIRDVLGPTISKALKLTENGINLNVLIAKAITMGDEFHQRNIAASLLFLKEISPLIIKLNDVDEQLKYEVIKFLSDTDQFFLNIMMAAGKSMVDSARKNAKGCIVTTMSRNGVNFGIRIAQANDDWFTAGVNTPYGLYFTGYSEEDGNPDIGDSAITETVGVGAMAMVAAPGVTRFVGAGGFKDALEISNEMEKITISSNPNWTIPTWDFKGSVLGIDIRKVVETGITPIINTGIAHKKAGIGQIGAGTVRAPLACFEKALEEFAKLRGIVIE